MEKHSVPVLAALSLTWLLSTSPANAAGILLTEIGANALKIEVEVVDGVVSLRGKLDNPESAKAAINKTRSIKGVKKVINLLG